MRSSTNILQEYKGSIRGSEAKDMLGLLFQYGFKLFIDDSLLVVAQLAPSRTGNAHSGFQAVLSEQLLNTG